MKNTNLKCSPLVATSGEQNVNHTFTNINKENKNMKNVNILKQINNPVNINPISNKRHAIELLEKLDMAFKQRHVNREGWTAAKKEVRDIYRAQLMEGYNNALYEGLSDDDILDIVSGNTEKAMENVYNAIDWLQYANERIDYIFTDIYSIALFGMPESGEGYKLSYPTVDVVLLPDHTGHTPVVNGAKASIEDVDIAALFRFKAWAIIKDRVNAVVFDKKDSIVKTWKRLNAEILNAEFKFGEEIAENVQRDGYALHVTTQGYGWEKLRNLEEQEFQRLNPIGDNEEPYPNDVRKLSEQIEAIKEEFETLDAKKAVRDRCAPAFKNLIRFLEQDNNRNDDKPRDGEARKAKAKIDVSTVSFPCPVELSTGVWKLSHGAELHYAEFNVDDSDAITAFFRERSKLNALERVAQKDRNRTLFKDRLVRAFLGLE